MSQPEWRADVSWDPAALRDLLEKQPTSVLEWTPRKPWTIRLEGRNGETVEQSFYSFVEAAAWLDEQVGPEWREAMQR